MKVVIADTSPLNYLVLIGAVEILPKLYGRIQVPAEVVAELSAAGAPSEVADWIRGAPDWLNVQTAPPAEDESLAELDPGERSAILLALMADEALLVIDDSAGRSEAAARNLQTIGTLGVLRLAATRTLVDLPVALARLVNTNFRISQGLVDALILEDRDRKARSTGTEL